MGLTGKQEKFAQLVASGKGLTEAYLLAGYKGDKGNENTHRLAVACSQNIKVASRIAELKAKTAEKFEYTREMAFQELIEAQKMAAELGQPSTVITAIDRKIKLAGLEQQPKTDSVPIVKIISPLTDDDANS